MTATAGRRELSAGGIVVYRDHSGVRYLLIRDSYRNWGFPKGHVESGETIESAAVREVEEETGLRDVRIRGSLDSIEWEFQFRGERIHKTCHFFLMETTNPATTPQLGEGITECCWTSFSDAERLVAYDNARAVLRIAHSMATR